MVAFSLNLFISSSVKSLSEYISITLSEYMSLANIPPIYVKLSERDNQVNKGVIRSGPA